MLRRCNCEQFKMLLLYGLYGFEVSYDTIMTDAGEDPKTSRIWEAMDRC